jgi:hypothetical protein
MLADMEKIISVTELAKNAQPKRRKSATHAR